MDALTLLREVSEAYRSLKTLSAEATILTESGDENFNQRNEHRVRFFYAAPDRLRYESCGKMGTVQVADGNHLHSSFGGPKFGGGPRYNKVPIAEMHRMPHLFRPDFPFSGGDEAFLFQRIDERVAEALILREEDSCHVISVSYEPNPQTSLMFSNSAVLFWVNTESRMVMRQAGEVGHRFPAEDEVTWSRHTVAVRNLQVNEALPEDAFRFTPPPDPSQQPIGQGGFSSAGGSSGFATHSSDGRRRLEHRSSHEWDGDTLVEHSKWKIRDMTLTFERRLTFSENEKELDVIERINGPNGQVETKSSLRLR